MEPMIAGRHGKRRGFLSAPRRWPAVLTNSDAARPRCASGSERRPDASGAIGARLAPSAHRNRSPSRGFVPRPWRGRARGRRRPIRSSSCAGRMRVVATPMLTVAPTACPPTARAASANRVPDALGDTRRFGGVRPRHQEGEFLAAEPSTEIAWRAACASTVSAKTCSTRSPIAWPNRSLIVLNRSRSASITVSGSSRLRPRAIEVFGVAEKGAPVRQPGQRIDQRGGLVAQLAALLGHRQQQECEGDRVEHRARTP